MKNRATATTCPPLSFMYDVGAASTSRGPGRPPGRMDAADYVLRDFSPVERKELPFVVADAVDAVERVLRDGWEGAQSVVNGQRRSREAR